MCAKSPTSSDPLRVTPRGIFVAGLLVLLGALGLAPSIHAAPPVIDSFTASAASAMPGEALTITVVAYDPDCGATSTCTSGFGACGTIIDAGKTQWTATDGSYSGIDNSTSGSPYTATAQWTAPMVDGVYTLTVSISDLGGGSLCFNQPETATADLGIQVSASNNQPPVIELLTAEPVQIFPGQSSNLTCTASDPDGDPFTYSWETTSGTINDTGGGTAVFNGSSVGIATVSCTATDPESAFGTDSIGISVTGAAAEKIISAGLEAPLRISATSWGDVYVVDGTHGSLAVVNVMTGALVYRLPVTGLSTVAVDWNDDLLVGGRTGAAVIDRLGQPVLELPGATDDVVDVAVDKVNRRYGVLFRRSGRVKIYDEAGTLVTAFGSAGDGPAQFMSAHGLAATPVNASWASVHWVVGDSGHGMVKVFDSAGQLASSFGGLGGGAGEFIQLGDVGVDDAGVIYASDSFQSWVQAFNPDGTPRETLGNFGYELGQLKTPFGVTKVEGFDRLVAASLNGPSLQVFVTSPDPVSEGPTPEAVASPTNLVFGDLPQGSTSAPQQVVLVNTGDAPLGLRSVEVQGNFLETSDCPPFLEPSQQCTFSLSFHPQTTGPLSGALVVDTSANESVEIALSGTGLTVPSLSLTPAQLLFAEQEVGTISRSQFSKLTNFGATSATLGGITATGQYMVSHNCPAVMSPSSYCLISVSFAPTTTAGQLLGTLTVASDAAGSPHAVLLEGTAIPASSRVRVVDVSVDEGDDPDNPVQASFDVQLSTPSDGTVAVDYATAVGTATEGGDFQPVSGTLAFAAGESIKTVNVPIVGDLILEPDEEDFRLELSAPLNTQIEDGTGLGTIVDDEICQGPNLVVNAALEADFYGQTLPDWTQAAPSVWEQIVDLAAFGQTILDGRQLLYFSGWVMATSDQPAPSLQVEYLDATTGDVLEVFDSGAIPAGPDWQQIFETRLVHPNTGAVRIRVSSTWTEPAQAAEQLDAFELASLRTPTLVVSDYDDYERGDLVQTDLQIPVTMPCPYYLDVDVNYRTVDGTATAGDDYQAASGALSLLPGESQAVVPVTVYGDTVDEDHETYYVELSGVTPTEVALVQNPGIGLILNDDACRLKAWVWRKNPDTWTGVLLQIGDTVYDQPGLLEFLAYQGTDMSTKLAKQLTATKLNLMIGTPPSILPVVEAADSFLTAYPPGTFPSGGVRTEGRNLKKLLYEYNASRCVQDGSGGSAQ